MQRKKIRRICVSLKTVIIFEKTGLVLSSKGYALPVAVESVGVVIKWKISFLQKNKMPI